MSRERISQLLHKFDSFTKKPTRFLTVQDNIKDDIKQFIKSIYDFAKLEENNVKGGSNDALPELIVDEFDEEQIWQELELQNCAQWGAFVESVSGVTSKSNLQFPVEHTRSAETSDTAHRDRDSHDGGGDDTDETDESPDQLNNYLTSKSSKRNKYKESSAPMKKKVKTSVVDDEFFNLIEMETFLEQEDKREMFREKQMRKNTDSDEDSIDLFEEDDTEGSDEENGENDKNINYKDFFDGPEPQSGSVHSRNLSDLDGESDLYSDEEREKEVKTKTVRFNVEDSESDDGDLTDRKAGTVGAESNVQIKLSDYEIRQERLRQKIDKLEQKSLAQKPWQLKGEVDAISRPQNSLLEEVVDFDLTTRPAPIITEETTLKLEDIIKQRIKDKVWDDIERKAKPVPETHEFRKAVVLDQEKSKVSLAQVYEQEYLKQKRAVAGDEKECDVPHPEQHTLIKKAMESLFSKLDALSNYHYTPKAAQPEVKIVSNIPAISMEEVAPVATSDAALLAPEEVKAKTKGDLMSKSERTTTDKKRERRKKKKLQREKEKEKGKKEKLLNKLNPGLGNKYSKEKAAKIIEKATKDFNNTDKVTQLNDAKALKSSKAFFTQLNDDINSSVKIKTRKNKNVLPAKKYKL